MKKQALTLPMALTMAVSGHALASDGPSWEKELGDHSGTSISMTTITDPFIESLKETKGGFEKLTGASIGVEGFGYDTLHDRQLLNCSQGNTTPEILVMDGIWMGEFVEAGCLEPIDDRIAQDADIIAWDDFTQDGATQAQWQGSTYCLPVAIYYELLFYRTDLLSDAGFEPPDTFAELKKIAAHFTDNPDYPNTYGYAMNNQRGAAAGQQYYEWIFNAGGKPWVSNEVGAEKPYADQTPLLDSQTSVELVEFFKDMVQYGPPGVESYAWGQRASGFANGSLAMINDWSVRAQVASDPESSAIAGKFASALMPARAGEDRVSPVGGWVMCMNASAENKDTAWDFMKWFASPEVHKEFVLNGGPPSRVSALTDEEIQEKWPWTQTLNEARKNAWAEVRPRHRLTFQLIDTVGIQVNKAIIGDKTPEQAMSDANEQATKMLRRGGLLE